MIEAHLEKSIPCVKISADVAGEKGSGAEEQCWRGIDSGSADKIRSVVAEMRRAIPLPEIESEYFASIENRAEQRFSRHALPFLQGISADLRMALSFSQKKKGHKTG